VIKLEAVGEGGKTPKPLSCSFGQRVGWEGGKLGAAAGSRSQPGSERSFPGDFMCGMLEERGPFARTLGSCAH